MKNEYLINFLIACETGDLDRAKEITINHQLPDTSNIDAGWTPLMRASGWGRNPQLVKYLIELGANIDFEETESGYTALACAAEEGNTEVIKVLVKLGSDIDHQDFNGKTALMSAIIFNELVSVKCLIALGANLRVKDNDGRSAHDIANGMEYDNIIEYFNEINL